MSIEGKSKTLILLVGSNPLPNYITAMVLKPEKIVMLYTEQTEKPTACLREVFKECGIETPEPLKVDAADVTSVKKCIKDIKGIDTGECHLNYTGGTKVMSAHARLAFQEAGGNDSQASYLYERKGLLYFDNGLYVELETAELNLTVERILTMHGISIKSSGNPPTSEELANARAKLVSKLEDPSIDTGGKWLEKLAFQWLKQTGMINDDTEIHININCLLSSQRGFEIDLSLVQGHRLFVISCTSTMKKDKALNECKNRLFEAATRARQLGGDLARVALICLLGGRDQNGLYIDQLKNDMESLWKVPNPPQVFGPDDVRTWEGLNGPKSYRSLKRWFEN